MDWPKNISDAAISKPDTTFKIPRRDKRAGAIIVKAAFMPTPICVFEIAGFLSPVDACIIDAFTPSENVSLSFNPGATNNSIPESFGPSSSCATFSEYSSPNPSDHAVGSAVDFGLTAVLVATGTGFVDWAKTSGVNNIDSVAAVNIIKSRIFF